MPLPDLPVRVDPLPYVERLQTRDASQVDLVVMHCTELPDLATARRYGERVLYPQRDDGSGGTGNSGHFYVDRDGSLHDWVDIERIAHHTRGYNPRSVGIELVNAGRFPDWLDSRRQAMTEPYAEAQILGTIHLLLALRMHLPALRYIAGHEDLDIEEVEASDDPALKVRRKRDPGPLFPWERVLRIVSLERIAAA